MKEYNILYYFLLVMGCVIVAILGGRGEFHKLIITLCYVYIALFSILNILIHHFQFSQTRQVAARVSFIILCFVITFYATNISDKTLFEHEFRCSSELFKIKNTSIKAKSGGYLINIIFDMPRDDLIRVVNKAGLYQISSAEISSHILANLDKLSEALENQTDGQKSRFLFFCGTGQEFSRYKQSCQKQILYDTNTETAYYEHLNYNGGD